MKLGKRNLITDVPGLRVGSAQDAKLKSGVTVVVGDAPMVCAVSIAGGAPGTRDIALLAPDKTVTAVDALVMSGGSAYGLDAAGGVVDGLRAQGRGFPVGPIRVPIAPGAILFDLLNGGEKGWRQNPYPELGRAALEAAGDDFALGSHGAGTGALTGQLKGGLGSASVVLDNGVVVGALAAVNPVGCVTAPQAAQFWAALYEVGAEFGGRGTPTEFAPLALPPSFKLGGYAERANTTLAVVATNAQLDKAQCHRMATAAQDGLARAILPAHTPLDGDLVFAASTGQLPLTDANLDLLAIGHFAAVALARACARAVFHATPAEGDPLPCWQEKWG